MAVRDGVSASFNSATAVHDARALILEQDRFSRAPEVDWARYAPEVESRVPTLAAHTNQNVSKYLITESKCSSHPCYLVITAM